MVQSIIVNQQVSPDSSSFAKVYDAAVKVERQATDVASTLRLRNAVRHMNSQLSKATSEAVVKPQSNPKSKEQHSSRDGQSSATTPRSDTRTSNTAIASSSKESRTAGDKSNTPSHKKKCFACGQMGHFSNDPKCPKYGNRTRPPNQRMHAQQIVDDREPEEITEPPPQGQEETERDPQVQVIRSDYGGSQYDSEEGRVEANDQESADDAEGSIRVGAIRVQNSDSDSENDHHDLIPRDESTVDSESDGGPVRMQMMRTDKGKGRDTSEVPLRSLKSAWLYNTQTRRLNDPSDQPKRSAKAQHTLCAQVLINGAPAYTLFDSGCTTDSITPEVAYVSHADRVDLKEQIGLQLGTKGSKTQISYGAYARLEVGNVNRRYYFDVVDIDKYDAILGTVFCSANKVHLDFENYLIKVNGIDIPALKIEEEAEMIHKRKAQRYQRATPSQQIKSTDKGKAKGTRRTTVEEVIDEDNL